MSTSLKIAVRIGLFTSLAILVFWLISQLTIYRYFRTEYYVAVVAVTFLTTGMVISRSKSRPEKAVNDPGVLDALTQKELTILQQIAEGKSNKEIAADNFVELSTIKTHINNIYTKLGAGNRKEAIRAYASARK
jgi:DNA-binding NarL/FixJ family response regulator